MEHEKDINFLLSAGKLQWDGFILKKKIPNFLSAHRKLGKKIWNWELIVSFEMQKYANMRSFY